MLHAVLHTFGHSGWTKSPDPLKQTVIKLMTDHSFPFMGVERSMGNYFDGYGYAVTIALVLIAVVLWLISDATAQGSALIKNIALVLAFGLLVWGIDEVIFFFPFAAGITLLSSLLVFVSVFQLTAKLKEFQNYKPIF